MQQNKSDNHNKHVNQGKSVYVNKSTNTHKPAAVGSNINVDSLEQKLQKLHAVITHYSQEGIPAAAIDDIAELEKNLILHVKLDNGPKLTFSCSPVQ